MRTSITVSTPTVTPKPRDWHSMKKVLDHILGVWVKHPDLRLGQLLHCSTAVVETQCEEFRKWKQDTFSIEDDKLIQLIQDFDERTATYKQD
jgi:hypothetical protein